MNEFDYALSEMGCDEYIESSKRIVKKIYLDGCLNLKEILRFGEIGEYNYLQKKGVIEMKNGNLLLSEKMLNAIKKAEKEMGIVEEEIEEIVGGNIVFES